MPPTATIGRWAAAVFAAGLTLTVVAETSPPPVSVVVVSSTTWDDGGRGPFTMTATNLGTEPASIGVPAPVVTDLVAVDSGSWDGNVWTVHLAPGGTATMSG